MSLIFGKIILMYLLAPLIAVILGVVMMIIAKKNKILQNKKAIIYCLLTFIILAIPALLGFINYAFMPYGYIFLAVVYLLLGYYNINLLNKFIDGMEDKPFYVKFLCQFFFMIIGAALFSLVFNLCNELQYGIWASTCLLPFILPSLFMKAYDTYIHIPTEIYKIWSYEKETGGMETEDLDSTGIILVELELLKQIADAKTFNVKAKTSENALFGKWFNMFVEHYNVRSPKEPIVACDADNSYGWLFYVNTFPFGKKHIDPDLSFADNRIKEKNVIIAKRAQHTAKQEEVK
jgi:hypothetical protein